MYVCMYVYVCICMCVYVCVYVCMYVCVCLCVCMHVYVCMHNILGELSGGMSYPKREGELSGGIVRGGNCPGGNCPTPVRVLCKMLVLDLKRITMHRNVCDRCNNVINL